MTFSKRIATLPPECCASCVSATYGADGDGKVTGKAPIFASPARERSRRVRDASAGTAPTGPDPLASTWHLRSTDTNFNSTPSAIRGIVTDMSYSRVPMPPVPRQGQVPARLGRYEGGKMAQSLHPLSLFSEKWNRYSILRCILGIDRMIRNTVSRDGARTYICVNPGRPAVVV
jgi:hypothetical protein